MKSLRERMGMPSVEDQVIRREQEAAFQDAFEKEVVFANWLTDKQEAQKRSPAAIERLGINNLRKALKNALNRMDDDFERMDWEDCDDRYATLLDDYQRERYIEEARRDLRGNMLYQLFLQQLLDENSVPITSSYLVFCQVISLQAALTLLCDRPQLREALGIAPGQLTADARVYKEQLDRGLHPQDNAHDFIASVLFEVEGIEEVSDQILHAYELAVASERELASKEGHLVSDTPLLSEWMKVEKKLKTAEVRDERMERALADLKAGKASIKNIAASYGIGHVQLRREAEQRGIAIQGVGRRRNQISTPVNHHSVHN